MTTRTRHRLAVGGLVVGLLAAGVWAGVSRWRREAARGPFVGVWAYDAEPLPPGVAAVLHDYRRDGTVRMAVAAADGRVTDTISGRWRVNGPEVVIDYDGRPDQGLGPRRERLAVEHVDGDRLVFAVPDGRRVVYRRHAGPVPD